MKVPVEWLREYVDVPATTDELARLLVMAGVEVEAVAGGVLELEITANRADLLSMTGVAREVAVLSGRRLRLPEPAAASGGAPPWKVEVPAPELCPRYTARVIRGVKVGPSPSWLASRLEAAGVRPVNNVVDVTNYVLLEQGQPLHAFDAKGLEGGRIVVRRAAAGEKLTAIDGKTYGLQPEMLVIADGAGPVAIAGVMGGKESEIGDASTDVVLESAQFDPVSVRRTSRKLGLRSESSYRFERGVDFATVDVASRRAVQLIVEIAGGKAEPGVAEAGTTPPERPVARVRPGRVSRVLGLEVAPARVRAILEGLGCEVKGDGTLEVRSPVGRRDLKIEADYIEEVARIEGYEKIPCDTGFGLRAFVENPQDLVREEVRATLSGLGAYEVLTWSFEEASAPNRVSFWTAGELLPLRDPDGRVDRTLRESMAPGLLKVLRTNEAYKEELHPVFEIARVYFREEGGYGEKAVVAVAAPGGPLEAKGLLEAVLARLGVEGAFEPETFPFLLPGTGAGIHVGGERVGYLGAPGPGVTDLRSPAGVAEVSFDALASRARLVRPCREFPRQPPVSRDLNMVLPDAVAWREVERAVRGAAPAFLESVRFLEEYRGKGVEPGSRAVHFSMLFRAADRTLTGGEVDEAVESVLKALTGGLGGRQR